MKKIVTLSVLALAVLLAGCDKPAPTSSVSAVAPPVVAPAPPVEDINDRIMNVKKRPLPTPPPPGQIPASPAD